MTRTFRSSILTFAVLAGALAVAAIAIAAAPQAGADDGARSRHARTHEARWVATKPLLAVDFVSASRGWVAGDGGLIMRTTNGGRSWAVQRRFRTMRAGILDLSFVSRSRGWACGTAGAVLRTTNGGATWRVQSPSPGSESLTSIKATGSRTVWTCGGYASAIFDDAHLPYGAVWRSATAGATWTRTDFSGFAPVALDPVNSLICYAVGPLRYQTDPVTGYNTWARTVTSDGGVTWSTPTEMSGAPLVIGTAWAIDFGINATVVVGHDDVANCAAALFTTDGSTWNIGTVVGEYSFSNVRAVSATTAYAVTGATRTVYKTTDSGLNWVAQDLPAGVRASDLDFVSGSTGFVAARYASGIETGRVYKTVNGGARWVRKR